MPEDHSSSTRFAICNPVSIELDDDCVGNIDEEGIVCRERTRQSRGSFVSSDCSSNLLGGKRETVCSVPAIPTEQLLDISPYSGDSDLVVSSLAYCKTMTSRRDRRVCLRILEQGYGSQHRKTLALDIIGTVFQENH